MASSNFIVGHDEALGTDEFDPEASQPIGTRGAALQYGRDAREVALADIRQASDPQQHRRHHGDDVDAVALDQIDQLRGVETFHHDDAVAVE